MLLTFCALRITLTRPFIRARNVRATLAGTIADKLQIFIVCSFTLNYFVFVSSCLCDLRFAGTSDLLLADRSESQTFSLFLMQGKISALALGTARLCLDPRNTLQLFRFSRSHQDLWRALCDPGTVSCHADTTRSFFEGRNDESRDRPM